MNITRNNIDALNAEIKIAVGPSDYEDRFNESLKKLQRKVTLPGFRPGKVPAGLVKKQYGASLLVDELNKLLDDSIQKYLSENKIDILGHPLPKQQEKVDFEKQREFEFVYELGLMPEFTVPLDTKRKFTFKTVKVDDKLVDRYIKDVRNSYGEHVTPDVAEEHDTLSVDINELDETGEIRPAGVFKKTRLQLEKLKDRPAHAKLLGAKVGDKIVLKVNELYATDLDKTIGLGIDQEKAAGMKEDLQVTVNEISRVNEAALDTALFDKLYGEGTIKNEDEFREKVRSELGRMFEADAERFFIRDIERQLVDETPLKLPDAFLKRWIAASNDKPISEEEIEREYPQYARAMQWQLIENRIVKDNNIRVSDQEAKDEAMAYVQSEYSRYGYTPAEDQIENHVKEILQREKDRRRIYDTLFARKVAALIREKCTVENAQVSYEEFFGA